MRQVFLDTETTGLYPDQGHRIIEIAAVELINRRPSNHRFHVYINPEREIDAAAQAVHGISYEFLQDKPLFQAVAEDFLAFIKDAEIIIHNAPFDVGFLNAELGRIGLMQVTQYCDSITDTLKLAKESRPGQRNNLDALCKHFGIDNSKRTLHGALLDAELLAEVYLAMTRGQDSLLMDLQQTQPKEIQQALSNQNYQLNVIFADTEELNLHQAYVSSLKKAGASDW